MRTGVPCARDDIVSPITFINSFSSGQSLTINNASVSVAWILWDTGDYNGDGRDDLLLRNPASGVVTDYIAQSDGSFVPNNAASYALPTSWFFQPNLSGAGYWDY